MSNTKFDSIFLHQDSHDVMWLRAELKEIHELAQEYNEQLLAYEQMTFWQRLMWAIRGER